MRRHLAWVFIMAVGCSTSLAQETGGEAIQTSPVAVASDADLESRFAAEPSLQEVYAMAEKESGINPAKVESWMRRASLRNLLPTFQARYDDSASDTLSFREDPDRVIVGPDDSTTGLTLTATWKLTELFYDRQAIKDTVLNSQRVLSIKTSLMNQVSDIYYERRRHQLELLISPPSGKLAQMEKKLRIDELTAQLDIVTGNRFSARIAGGKP